MNFCDKTVFLAFTVFSGRRNDGPAWSYTAKRPSSFAVSEAQAVSLSLSILCLFFLFSKQKEKEWTRRRLRSEKAMAAADGKRQRKRIEHYSAKWMNWFTLPPHPSSRNRRCCLTERLRARCHPKSRLPARSALLLRKGLHRRPAPNAICDGWRGL